MIASIVWRRVDRPGHEAASIARFDGGWRLSGAVALEHDGLSCRLDYSVDCDDRWYTRRCEVRGFIGDTAVTVAVSRDSDARWRVNGAPAPQVDGCDDVDLAFTPMTNLLPIRRLSLDVGVCAVVRAAWVRFPELVLEPLEQRYTRIAPMRYLYESASGAFRRELTVDDAGLVLDYPGLWIAEARSTSTEPW